MTQLRSLNHFKTLMELGLYFIEDGYKKGGGSNLPDNST